MRLDKQSNQNDSRPPNKRGKFELFYFETEGRRSYLRLTKLAVVLILCMTVIAVVAMITLFLYNRSSSNPRQVDVNISISPSPNMTPLKDNIIKMPPPPQLSPKVRQRPLPPVPTPSAVSPESNGNTNEQIVPRQTPQRQTTKPPT